MYNVRRTAAVQFSKVVYTLLSLLMYNVRRTAVVQFSKVGVYFTIATNVRC